MRYIDPKDFEPIISDFNDEISSFEDAIEEQLDFSLTVDDFKTLEEKVLFHTQSDPNS
jgi:type I restriction enzyme R subunit